MRLDKFLFCETVRQEASGQQTLVGVFANDTVGMAVDPSVDVSVANLAMPTLSMYAVLDQMQGVSNLRIQCEVKFNGTTVQRSPPIDVVRPDSSQRSHTVHITFSPFTFSHFGEYVFKLILEERGNATSFSRRLRLERQDATIIPPPSNRH